MKLDRRLLAKAFPGQPALIAQFEELSKATDDVSTNASSTAQATETLQDATVLVLSPSGAFNGERVLKIGTGVRAVDNGSTLTLSLDRTVARVLDYSLRFLPADDATLFVQEGGTVMVRERPMIEAPDAADDAAAAVAGVPVGGIYHASGALRVRLV